MKNKGLSLIARAFGYILILPIAILAIAVFVVRTFFATHYPKTVAEVVSPDNQWIATLELVDDGAGFGMGMLYDEIHVRRSDEQITRHLDWPNPAVFCTDAMAAVNSAEPKIMWKDSNHLVIIFDPARSINTARERATSFHGVKVKYVATPSAQM
jgi:hypothetical protein